MVVQIIEENRRPTVGERFGSAFSSMGQAFPEAFAQHVQKQEEKRQFEETKAGLTKATGIDLSQINDPAILKQFAGDYMEQEKQRQLYSLKPPEKEKDLFGEELQRVGAKTYNEIRQQSAIADDTLASLDHLDTLVDKMSGVKGAAKAAWGSADAAMLEAESTTAIQSIIKLFNPSGPIAKSKLDFILSKHAVKTWERSGTSRGKIEAVRRFTEAAKARNDKYADLLYKYRGQVPPNIQQEFDSESMAIAEQLDSELDKEESTPKKVNKKSSPAKQTKPSKPLTDIWK